MQDILLLQLTFATYYENISADVAMACYTNQRKSRKLKADVCA